MGINYSPKIVTNGLVLCLDAANSLSYPGSGTVWTDLSGNGNNGTLTNGPTYSSSNKGSIVFDGSNDYVAITDNSLFNFSTNMSIDCWTSFSTVGSRMIFCGKGDANSTATTQYWLEKSSTNSIIFYTSANNQDRTLNSNFTVLNNTWYNIIGTYDGSSMRVYVNGNLKNSVAATGSINTTNKDIAIGKLYSIYYLNGNISNFNLYNRALTANEVLQNYNATKGRFNL